MEKTNGKVENVNVVLVTTDDYEAIYFDGVLKDTESMFHTSTIGEMLVGYGVLSFETKYIPMEELEARCSGDFPHYLSILGI